MGSGRLSGKLFQPDLKGETTSQSPSFFLGGTQATRIKYPSLCILPVHRSYSLLRFRDNPFIAIPKPVQIPHPSETDASLHNQDP